MSRLYEIIRQMEERFGSAPKSTQEIALISSLGSDKSGKSRWRFYRVAILVGVVTVLGIAGITLGPPFLRGIVVKSRADLKPYSQVASLVHHPGFMSRETYPEVSTQKLPARDTKPKTTNEQSSNTSDHSFSSETSVNDSKAVRKEKPTAHARASSTEKANNSEPGKITLAEMLRELQDKEKATQTIGSANRSPRDRTVAEERLLTDKDMPSLQSSAGPEFSLNPVHPQNGMIMLAEEARQRGDISEAMRIYRRYLASHQDPSVMNNLGAALIIKGQLEEAERVLKQAFQLAPADADIATNLIGVEIMLRKKSQACEIFRRFKKNSASVPPSVNSLASRLAHCPPSK